MTALIAGAFAAGMVATVNPCGFAMLPAYLGWFLAIREWDGVEHSSWG
jgi:cytochrome c-type biogenesis protein